MGAALLPALQFGYRRRRLRKVGKLFVDTCDLLGKVGMLGAVFLDDLRSCFGEEALVREFLRKLLLIFRKLLTFLFETSAFCFEVNQAGEDDVHLKPAAEHDRRCFWFFSIRADCE